MLASSETKLCLGQEQQPFGDGPETGMERLFNYSPQQGDPAPWRRSGR
jgi:hypothetical protein